MIRNLPVVPTKDEQMPNIHILRTELGRTLDSVRTSVRTNGLAATASRIAAVAGGHVALPLIRAGRSFERFEFLGHRLPYTLARYNNSFLNERAVEISIARWFLAQKPGRVLEVGNVLSHYGFRADTVVDKYEVIPGVLNHDIVDFSPEEPFDTVVAISTLEHVGWDEHPRRPEKVLRAVENLRKVVRQDGRILVTTPVGHNRTLDLALRSGEISFPRESWLVRNRRNEWRETDREEALGKRYGSPYTGANGLFVGMAL